MNGKTNKTKDLAAVQKVLELAGLRIKGPAECAGCGKSIRR